MIGFSSIYLRLLDKDQNVATCKNLTMTTCKVLQKFIDLFKIKAQTAKKKKQQILFIKLASNVLKNL